MKKSLMALLLAGLVLGTSAFNHASAHGETTKFHVGKITQPQLRQNYEIFEVNYDQYSLKPEDIAIVKRINRPIEIVGLFGTWCHDSQRETPRLMKLLDVAKNTHISLSLLAVNDDKEADAKYRLTHTPTFIVYLDSKEIGRIVEKPEVSLAQDLVTIVESHEE